MVIPLQLIVTFSQDDKFTDELTGIYSQSEDTETVITDIEARGDILGPFKDHDHYSIFKMIEQILKRQVDLTKSNPRKYANSTLTIYLDKSVHSNKNKSN